MVGKSDSKENPKSDLDLDLGFVNRLHALLDYAVCPTIHVEFFTSSNLVIFDMYAYIFFKRTLLRWRGKEGRGCLVLGNY